MTFWKSLARFGHRGAMVRVFTERGGELVRVQWRDGDHSSRPSRGSTRPTTVPQRKPGRKRSRRRDSRHAPAEPVSLTLREIGKKYLQERDDRMRQVADGLWEYNDRE